MIAKLRSYVRGRVAPVAVDDVTGDILLRLVQHRHKLAGARNPSAWMYRVASNAVADYHRHRDVEKRYLDGYRDEPVAQTGNEPKDLPAVRELAACLRPLLSGLPPLYAQALQMTEIDGTSQTAAARRLGVSVPAMKSRVQRGRAQLKAALLCCCEIELGERGGILEYHRRPGHCDC